MIGTIARFEFRYLFFSLQTLIVGGVFFILAFIFTANGVEFQGTARGGNVFINSPYMISQFLILLSILSVFIAPSYVASAILKDKDCQFDSILLSTPLSKFDYVVGRFLGAFGALVIVISAAPLGMWLGTLWPWAVPETLTTNMLSHYLSVFIYYMLPSVFTLSALIYAVALITRKMLFCYFMALAMVILFITVDVSTTVSGLWDPFMADLFEKHSQYWTAVERNTNLVELQGPLLVNRVLWFSLSIVIFTIAYHIYLMRGVAKSDKLDPKKDQVQSELKAAVNLKASLAPTQSRYTHFHQLLFRTKFEIMSVIKSTPFLILMSLSFFLLFFTLTGRQTLYDVNTYPLTRILLGAISQALTGALMVILAFYSADIMWREKSSKFNGIIDALPVPNWVFVASKIAALALVMHAIVLLGIVMAVSLQILNGYNDFQFSNYIGRGLFYYTIAYVYLAVLACFFQVLANSRVVGMLLFIVFVALLALSRDILGVEHALLSYGLPGIAAPMSDMNDDSRFATAGMWLRLYWGAIAGMLIMLTYMMWTRGISQPMRFRIRQLATFNNKGSIVVFTSLLMVFISSGSFIYYNTNILNEYRTSGDLEQLQLGYERKYRQFEHLPMPRIIEVKMDVDIYPYQRRVEARSTQILENKTDESISTIHLIFPIQSQVVAVNLQGATQESVDKPLAYYIYKLDKPLMPSQRLTLTFELLIAQQGFENSRQDIRLVRNGSFIDNNQLAPRVGFYNGLLLRDKTVRRKHGLAPLPRVPALDDISAHNRNYVTHDADFINFETTVSTVLGQQAIAPGYLTKDWQQGNRHYFNYKMDKPIMNFYSYLSADYEVEHDNWNGVDIDVFYHKAHNYNVKRMVAGVKDSLAYYSRAFGPYQYRQLRIIEFPSYQTLARAYPNTIPFSEDIGFVSDQTDPNQIDLPYYITAHEVAHQWWAHQVMAAHSQGGTMVVETLAQYSALLVMEKKYGKHQLRKFLKLELDKYLRGRAKESEGELPLFKVENQPYIHYRKGALVMYALKDYVGEEVVNRALKRFVNNHAFQSQPYALSTDFMGYLRQEVEPQHYSMIEDMFEKITLFDLKIDHSHVEPLADGRFKVTLTVQATKHYEDAIGNKTPATINMAIDIGLFSRHPSKRGFGEKDVIMLKKHKLTAGETTLEYIVDQQPHFAGIDPYNKLIDTNSEDNLGEVTLLD